MLGAYYRNTRERGFEESSQKVREVLRTCTGRSATSRASLRNGEWSREGIEPCTSDTSSGASSNDS